MWASMPKNQNPMKNSKKISQAGSGSTGVRIWHAFALRNVC